MVSFAGEKQQQQKRKREKPPTLSLEQLKENRLLFLMQIYCSYYMQNAVEFLIYFAWWCFLCLCVYKGQGRRARGKEKERGRKREREEILFVL